MIVREFINLIGFDINQAQLGQVTNTVDGLLNKMEAFGRKASLFITLPFIGLSVAIATTLSEFEQLDVAFTVMLGSAEKGKALLAELFELAATTPFTIQGVTQSGKQLLAMGIESENLIETLTNLGNVAAGVGGVDILRRMSLNLGQVKALGKLSGREVRDFATAGIPLLGELAQNLGKTTKEIQTMVSAGSISFEDVTNAFRTMATGSGKFADLMIKQSKTLGGLWSNFLDRLTLSAKSMNKKLLPLFKGFVAVLLKLVRMLERLNPEMKLVIFVMGGIAALVGPLVLGFALLARTGMFVVTMFNFMTAAAVKAQRSLTSVILRLALIGVAVIAVIAAIALITEDIVQFVKGNDSLLGQFLEPWVTLGPKIMAALGPFLILFGELWDDVLSIIKSTGAFFIAIFSDDTETATKAIENIIKKSIDGIIVLLAILIPAVGIWLKAMFMVFMKMLPVISIAIANIIWTAVKGIVIGVQNIVVDAIKSLWTTITDFFSNLGAKIPGLSSLFSGSLNGTVTGIGADGIDRNAIGAQLQQGSTTNNRGGNVQNDNTFNITTPITVPEGTTEEQRRSIAADMGSMVRSLFETEINNLAIGSGATQ